MLNALPVQLILIGWLLDFNSGMLLQWGLQNENKAVTYPIAFTSMACPITTKYGCGTGYQTSDTGITEILLTGFTLTTAGRFYSQDYLAIGF